MRVGAPGNASAQPRSGGAAGRATSIAAPSEAVAEQYRLLAELPRPRPVRMSRQGKMNATIISISLLVFAGALVAMVVMQPVSGTARIHAPPRPLVYVLPLVAGCGDCIRDAALARAATVAALRGGTCHGPRDQAVDRAQRPRNPLRIHDAGGETFSRMTTDNARQLLVGMTRAYFLRSAGSRKSRSRSALLFMKLCCLGKNKS